MSKNPLLLGWLMDTKDDCFPYYFSKLEFLQMYGKQCSNHAGSCKSAKTEQECNNKGRFLKCTYTEGECVQVIDSICNYYDNDGNVKEEEWGEDQVKYISDIYKIASNVYLGEFMNSKGYEEIVKTNAFQIISEKINNAENDEFINLINSILSNNSNFMDNLLNIRTQAYDDFTKKYIGDNLNDENILYDKRVSPFENTNTVKKCELVFYIFEIFKEKNCPSCKKGLFIHDTEDDKKIIEILKNNNLSIDDNKNNEKNIALEKNDYKHEKGIGGNIIWVINKLIFGTIIGSTKLIGNILLLVPKLIRNYLFHYKNMSGAIIGCSFSMILLCIIGISITFFFPSLFTVVLGGASLIKLLTSAGDILSALIGYIFGYCLYSIVDTFIISCEFIMNLFTGGLQYISKQTGGGINNEYINELQNSNYIKGLFLSVINSINSTHAYTKLLGINKSKELVVYNGLKASKEHLGLAELIKKFIQNIVSFLTSSIDKLNKGVSVNLNENGGLFKSLFTSIKQSYDNPDSYAYLKAFISSMQSGVSSISSLLELLYGFMEFLFLKISGGVINTTGQMSKVISEIYNLFVSFFANTNTFSNSLINNISNTNKHAYEWFLNKYDFGSIFTFKISDFNIAKKEYIEYLNPLKNVALSSNHLLSNVNVPKYISALAVTNPFASLPLIFILKYAVIGISIYYVPKITKHYINKYRKTKKTIKKVSSVKKTSPSAKPISLKTVSVNKTPLSVKPLSVKNTLPQSQNNETNVVNNENNENYKVEL